MNKLAKAGCSVVIVVGILLAKYGSTIRTSEQGLLLIGNAEGCRQNPYQCPANVLTVGIGTTQAVEKIQPNKTYSLEEIARLYAKGIEQAEQCVNRYANGQNMPQGAYFALTSITFNVGCGKLQNSNLFKMARTGYTPQMCDQFERWIYAGGNPLKGLQIRRAKEKALCLTS